MSEQSSTLEVKIKTALFYLGTCLSLLCSLLGGFLWARPITEFVDPAHCGWVGLACAAFACLISRMMKRSVARFFVCLGLIVFSLSIAGLGLWLLVASPVWIPLVIVCLSEGGSKDRRYIHPLHKLAAAFCMLCFPVYGVVFVKEKLFLGWYIGLTLLLIAGFVGGFYFICDPLRYRLMRRETAVALFLFTQLWMLPLAVNQLIAMAIE